MPAEVPLEFAIAAVKRRPRYRAAMVRECFIEELTKYPGGSDLGEVGREFWVRYGFEPTRNLLSQQAQLLVNDGRILRIRQGWYQLAPAPKPASPAAHAPTAGSIFD